MPQDNEDIRGVLIQIVGGKLLLPNANVSEVITLSAPDPVEEAPDWILGRVPWRGWQVPLFSFAVLAGLAGSEPRNTARVCILKAFGEHRRLPFMALLAQGFPRLTTLRRDNVVAIERDEDEPLPPGVLSRVRIQDDDAMVPDMGAIEDMIADALKVDDEAAAEQA